MAYGYDSLIAVITSDYATANGWAASVNAERIQALSDWNAGNDHAAIADIIEGMWATNQALVNLLSKGYWGWNGATNALPNALDRNKACPFITEAPPFELTMDDIINTMLTASPEQVNYFVGLVDAYRVSIWDKPFNEEFFAALARGFM